MVEIIPSILSADFARLAEEALRVESGGARMLHVDVMDGHFVPNLTLGPQVVESLRKATRLTLDVHLMITDPGLFAPAFIQAGADLVSVHQETCPHLHRTLEMIKGYGVKAGVVLNPSTPLSTLEEVLPLADFVLIMSVNPGFGGQQFIARSLDKVRRLAHRRQELGLEFAIEIDGGVTQENLPAVVRAGCDWIVTGSSVFHTPDPGATVAAMRRAAREAAAIAI